MLCKLTTTSVAFLNNSGYIAGVYYRRYKKDKSLRNIMNYGYFISMFILFSNIHINSIVIYYIWPLLMERFLYKKNKKDV